MRCPTCDTVLYLRNCPGYMDKILYCDKCYAYWPEVRSQKEIDELHGQIAALKAALLERELENIDPSLPSLEDAIEIATSQLAQAYPKIFVEEMK